MKLLILLVSVATLVAVQGDGKMKEKMMEFAKACGAEVSLSDEDMKKAQSHDFSNPSDNMKCFSNCMVEKMGVIKDGVIDEQVLQEKLDKMQADEKLDKAKAEEILNDCKAVKGGDKCETGFLLKQCFFKHFSPQ